MKTLQRNILSLIFLLGTSGVLIAQPDYYNYNTFGTGNCFPWNTQFPRKIQLLYIPGSFSQPSPAPSGYINKLSLFIYGNLGPWTYTDLTIKMGLTTSTSFGLALYTGSLSTVYYSPSVSLVGTSAQWMTIVLDSSFYYDSTMSLIIDISHCGSTSGPCYPGSACTSTTNIGGGVRVYSGWQCPFAFAGTDGNISHMGISLGSLTGINETKDGKYSVHPVPSDGLFVTSITYPGKSNFTISVYNELGVLAYEAKDITVAGFTEHSIDIRSLPAGIYLVTFQNNDRQVVNKIIMTK